MAEANWQLYVDGSALVAEFPEGMPTDPDEFAKVNEQFEELARRPAVDAHISVLNMEKALNKGVFGKAQEAARVGTEFGITRWAIVSDGIKNLALKSRVEEVADVETMTTDDMNEALAWAKDQ